MQPSEFLRLTQGNTDAFWRDYFEVGEATLRRWKSGQARIPGAVARLLELNCSTLTALAGAGPEWGEFSFHHGKFFHPFWREGFTPGELKAMFFMVQDARHKERDESRLLAENAALRAELARRAPTIRIEIDGKEVYSTMRPDHAEPLHLATTPTGPQLVRPG